MKGGLNGYIIDYYKDYIFDREYSLHLLIHSVSHYNTIYYFRSFSLLMHRKHNGRHADYQYVYSLLAFSY